jgi:hypothetical protein
LEYLTFISPLIEEPEIFVLLNALTEFLHAVTPGTYKTNSAGIPTVYDVVLFRQACASIFLERQLPRELQRFNQLKLRAAAFFALRKPGSFCSHAFLHVLLLLLKKERRQKTPLFGSVSFTSRPSFFEPVDDAVEFVVEPQKEENS